MKQIFENWLKERNLTIDTLEEMVIKLNTFLNENKNCISINASNFLINSLRKENKYFYIDSATKENIPIDIAMGINKYCESLMSNLDFYKTTILKKFLDDSKFFKNWQEKIFIPQMNNFLKLFNSATVDIITGDVVKIPENCVFSDKRITSSLLRVLNDYDGYQYIDFYELIESM